MTPKKPEWGYSSIKKHIEIARKKIEDYQSGKIKPIYTSSAKVNQLITGFFPGDMIILLARSGIGKTARLISFFMDICNPIVNPDTYNKNVILYDSWEMKGWRNILRMLAHEMRMTAKTFLKKGTLTAADFIVLNTTLDELERLPIFINEKTIKVQEWKDKGYVLKDKFPDKQIFRASDHSRLITASNERTEEALLTSYMKAAMELKNETDEIILILSQMNRNYENSTDRSNIGKYLPQASDVFGSDAIFQCADIVLYGHRPGYYNLDTFELGGVKYPTGLSKTSSEDNLWIEGYLKQRDGGTGIVTMLHEVKYCKFLDL